jgi:hypothetical protein
MSPTELLERWRSRASRMQLAHRKAAREFDSRHLWLGLPAIAFSTVVGTTIFASLSENREIWLRILVGLLSVTAALLTALQTFLKYSELSEKHRVAGAKFASLKHRIELISAMPLPPLDELKQQLTMIEDHWERVREESPNLPARIWQDIEKSLGLGEYSNQQPSAAKDA